MKFNFIKMSYLPSQISGTFSFINCELGSENYLLYFSLQLIIPRGYYLPVQCILVWFWVPVACTGGLIWQAATRRQLVS